MIKRKRYKTPRHVREQAAERMRRMRAWRRWGQQAESAGERVIPGCDLDTVSVIASRKHEMTDLFWRGRLVA